MLKNLAWQFFTQRSQARAPQFFICAYLCPILQPNFCFSFEPEVRCRSFLPPDVSPSSSIFNCPLVSMDFVYMDAKWIGWTAVRGVCICNIITHRRGRLEFADPELAY